MNRLSLFLGLLVSLLASIACAPILTNNQPPEAIEGVLDLRGWDFERNGAVALKGEWELYWEQLLTSDDFANPPTRTGFIDVPQVWQGYEVNGQILSAYGYATYRLTILIEADTLPEASLALSAPLPISTAHSLYVEGQLVGSGGKVGTTAETMTPQSIRYFSNISPVDNEIEILLHLSNFYDPRGGIPFEAFTLGSQSQIQQRQQQRVSSNFFIVGSLFIIGLYHLTMFGLRRRETPLLYFGLFCLCVAAEGFVTNQLSIFTTTINFSWAGFIRTRLFIALIAVINQALFVHTLFGTKRTNFILSILVGLGIIFASLTLLLPSPLFSVLIFPTPIYAISVGLYSLGLVLLAAVHRKDEAIIFLAGYLPLVLTIINDALFFNNIIQSRPLISLGLFIFILAQAYLLSARFAKAYQKSESLSSDLQRQNQSLKDTQAELEVSEAKYRTIFEDSKAVIFITNLQGEIEEINSACFELLGYTRAEILANNLLDTYVDPADVSHFQRAMTEQGAVTDFPLNLRHKAGHELEGQVTATLRHDETGQITGYQGIIHDLTAYKQAEANRQRVLVLQSLNQTLEQRVEARTAALSEANTALQAEIERRESHQQEKERLLALAQQQSEHLRTMSSWVMERQQTPLTDSTDKTDGDIQQKMVVIRQNLATLQNAAALAQDPSLITYVADTLRLLAEMEIYLDQTTTPSDEPIDSSDPLVENPLLQLSSRERQVLRLIAEGKSNPEIADILTIRLNTVHTYLKRIRFKLDIQDIPGLIEFARRNRLLE